MEKLKEYTNPEYYENRELSWIKFNGRVLNEARDKSIPLLERLKICQHYFFKSGRIFHGTCGFFKGYGTCGL